MNALTVGELKTYFSEVISKLQKGEEFTIQYGRKKHNVAVIIPYEKYYQNKQRTLGVLANKGAITIQKDFTISDEELLHS